MTRQIDAATQTASEADVILPVWFVKLEFDSGDIRLHTSLGTINFDGESYTGAGAIGGIDTVEEDAELTRSTLKLTLRGLPNDIISIILNEYYQGRTATLYLGYLNQTTRLLTADPIIIYRGRMDTASVAQGETCAVTVTVESRFAAWDRPLTRRYNHADQQSRYPGDRGCEFVEQATEKQIVWGQRYAG
ncbi:hypothetical protein [Tautonia plasticadhaerens]|uniref:Uncharacterized protein n=1 Tax=Tautonia plasticadhaerens TaxID=2527974 RepID=A0A518H237_9BACT|nr:hypothetical protein [Tautonia plasticadhaerens]QDV34895.1 hypothetical protein ElP_27920 [Tautonia plasticadhaerens]